MARNAQAWLEKGRFFVLALGRKSHVAQAELGRAMRGTLAGRLIADAKLQPRRADERQSDGPAHVIDLSIIRDALGAKWAHYADDIHRITASTIELHLDRAHSFAREADRYVLNFTGATPYAAMDRTRTISAALAHYLFGCSRTPAPRSHRAESERLLPLAIPQLNWRQIRWTGVLERLRAVIGSVKAMATGLPSDDDRAARRHVWIGAANEPRIFGIADGSDATESELGAPTRPISADAIAPSRSAMAQPSHERAANDDGVPSLTAAAVARRPTIAADFNSPSQPMANSEIDLDEATALETAMRAAVERLARDGDIPIAFRSYRRAIR